MAKIMFWHHCYLALKSRSKVGVKFKDHRSGSNFWRAAVDIRGSAVPSAAKKSHYQSKVFACVAKNRLHAVDWPLKYKENGTLHLTLNNLPRACMCQSPVL